MDEQNTTLVDTNGLPEMMNSNPTYPAFERYSTVDFSSYGIWGPFYCKVMSAGGVVTELENIPSEESFDPEIIAPDEYSTPEPHPNSTPRPTPADNTCTEGALVF